MNSSSTPMAVRSTIRKPATPAIHGQKDVLSGRSFLAAALVTLGVAFFAYLPALNFQFILDDHRFVSDPRLQSSGHIGEYFTNYVWAQFSGGPASFYRPLFVLWLRFNFILSEMSPWGWHFLSIVKHLLVVAALGVLVWVLVRDYLAVWIATTLFALHPAQNESIAWVTVPDPLMSLAVLVCLLLFLKYAIGAGLANPSVKAQSSGKSRQPKPAAAVDAPSAVWLLGSAAACLAALLVKETSVILAPLILILAAVLPAREESASRAARALKLSLPFFLVTILYLGLRFHALGGKLSPETQHLPLKTVLLSMPATLWFYLKVLFWPVRLRAFADPSQADSFSVRGVLLPGLAVALTLGVLAGILVWVWRKAKHLSYPETVRLHYALLIGVLLLVLPFLPSLNLNALNPGDFLHGRYTYLPLAGLMLLVATVCHLASKGRRYMLLGTPLLAVVFLLLTVRQEQAWKDDLTVFTVAHQLAPHNGPVALSLARAQVQRAIEMGENGQCSDAVAVFEEVIRQYPQDWFGWAGLGNCLAQLKDLAGAEQALRRAAELSRSPQVAEEWQEVRARMAASGSSAK